MCDSAGYVNGWRRGRLKQLETGRVDYSQDGREEYINSSHVVLFKIRHL